jgi:hypothetical protein
MNGDKPTDDEVSLDVSDVDLAEPAQGRGTAPPPLPASAYASSPPPALAPSMAPPAPEPRSKLVYVLVLAACLVASIAIGAVWARSSAPKAPAAMRSAAVAAPAPSPATSASSVPKVITIKPVDMSNEAP